MLTAALRFVLLDGRELVITLGKSVVLTDEEITLCRRVPLPRGYKWRREKEATG